MLLCFDDVLTMLSSKVFVVIEVENEAEVDFFVQNIGPGKKENFEFIKTRYFEILLRRLRLKWRRSNHAAELMQKCKKTIKKSLYIVKLAKGQLSFINCAACLDPTGWVDFCGELQSHNTLFTLKLD